MVVSLPEQASSYAVMPAMSNSWYTVAVSMRWFSINKERRAEGLASSMMLRLGFLCGVLVIGPRHGGRPHQSTQDRNFICDTCFPHAHALFHIQLIVEGIEAQPVLPATVPSAEARLCDTAAPD